MCKVDIHYNVYGLIITVNCDMFTVHCVHKPYTLWEFLFDISILTV